MPGKNHLAASATVLLALIGASEQCHAQSTPSSNLPVSISVYDRTRVDSWQWFGAPPASETYGYGESLVRLGVAQRIHQWDWQLEVAQPAMLRLPNDAISPVTAQGQLGLGGTYYASNSNNTNPQNTTSCPAPMMASIENINATIAGTNTRSQARVPMGGRFSITMMT